MLSFSKLSHKDFLTLCQQRQKYVTVKKTSKDPRGNDSQSNYNLGSGDLVIWLTVIQSYLDGVIIMI